MLASGDELPADIVVTATGLELLFLGGIDLTVDGEPVDPASRLTYKGMMIEGVPNLAVAIGYTNASWTLKCDLTCQYVCRLLDFMRSHGQTQCVPRNADASVTAGGPLLGLYLGLHPALGAPAAPTGCAPAVEGEPELPARLPRPAHEPGGRRRHGVQRSPRPERRGRPRPLSGHQHEEST